MYHNSYPELPREESTSDSPVDVEKGSSSDDVKNELGPRQKATEECKFSDLQ